jgi:phosphoglycolate phosphatase-like HAD superfamily hydrolase
MNFIIDCDGPIIDVRPVHYRAFREVVAELGWSCLDEATYWRLVRAKGREANLLPGAKPGKHAQLHEQFARVVESPEIVGAGEPHRGRKMNETIQALARHGRCAAITIGVNVETRRELLDRHRIGPLLERIERLNEDPRRRPAELTALSQGDRHTIVAAASDAIIRAAREANLFALGISTGPCSAARLHQAGADVVYDALDALPASLAKGAPDLIAAGLPPKSLG